MRKNHFAIYYTLILSIITAGGCSPKQDYIARVNDKLITSGDINHRISKLPRQYQDIVRINKKKFVDELVVDELIYSQAKKEKLDKDKDVREIIEEASKKIVIAKYLKDNIDDKVSVSEGEIREYYQDNAGEFKTPEIFHAAHILTKTEAESENVLKRIASGEKFEDLAREVSIDATAERGGDIGYFVRGQVDSDFEKACVGLHEGRVSPVIKTKFGYHVIMLIDRRPPAIEKFDDVKERIRQNLLTVKKKKAFNDLVAKLKSQNKVEVKYDAPYMAGASAGGASGKEGQNETDK